MKKTLIFLMFMSMTALCFLTSCNKEETSKTAVIEEWEFNADTLEKAADIYEDFFYLTIADPNMIVTVSDQDGMLFIDTIDDYNEHVQFASGTENYICKDGDNYYYAVISNGEKYYYNDREMYYDMGLFFTPYVEIFETLKDSANVTLKSKGTSTITEYNVELNATLTAEIKYDDVVVNVVAVKENDSVRSCTIKTTKGNETETILVTFTSIETKVDLPDLTDWLNLSEN